MEPKGQDLVRRYRRNYRISADCAVTEEMVLKHWQLEKSLRRELLESHPDNRWAVFENCYSRLYNELDWLNHSVGSVGGPAPAERYSNWIDAIGSPPKKIYEVGSGKGELISFLAGRGFECRATEITQERGERWSGTLPNLTWSITDGIHLDEFEPTNSYDVVISNQVIEHLHPHDLTDHFKGVFSILASGGRYIFSTPHASVGPSDISSVFRADWPSGMHLREYTYKEIVDFMTQTGFKQIQAVFPNKVCRLLGRSKKSKTSDYYLNYLCGVEKFINVFPSQSIKRKVSIALKLALFSPDIVLVGKKP